MNESKPAPPPKWPDKLLEWFCAPHLLEEVQGDLHERYYLRAERIGEAKARWYYLREVLAYLRPSIIKRKPTTPTLYIDMFTNYLKITWRNLLKNKGYALINVIGLATGISACLIIYLLVSFEFSFDTFHPDKERIYRVLSRFENAGETSLSSGVIAQVPLAMREEISGLETVAAIHYFHAKVTVPDGTGRPKTFLSPKILNKPDIAVVEPQYFQIFPYEWAAGNPAQSLQAPNQVVLSESKARLYFGLGEANSYLGKQLYYNDSIQVTVSGILKNREGNSDFSFGDFISFATIQKPGLKSFFKLDNPISTMLSSQAFVKLAPGTTPAQVEAQFPPFIKKNTGYPFMGSNLSLQLQPLLAIHFATDFNVSYERTAHLPTLYVLIGIAAFLLLIAAINFVNLATALSINRLREVGIRKVLGENRKSLIAQFFSETLVLTLIAVLLSLLLLKTVLQLFGSFIPAGLNEQVFKPELLLFVFLVLVISAVLSGFYPAWLMSSFAPVMSMKNQLSVGNTGKTHLRKALIIFQFTVSLVFIIGTLLVNRQTHFMLNKDLGFHKEAIIHFETSRHGGPDRKHFLLDKLRNLSGVERVSLSTATPGDKNFWINPMNYFNGKETLTMSVHQKYGDSAYAALYGLQLLAGRHVQNSDTIREYVINDTYRKALGFKSPQQAIGQQVEMGNRKYPIVGVVADFHVSSMHEPIAPTAIASMNQFSNTINVKLHTGAQGVSDYRRLIGRIENIWKEIYPEEPFEYQFFDDSLAQLYEKEQKTSQLLNTATILAILISCMGLFGLATFTAGQRTKEVGIRKVLGASVISIVALLSKDFLRLVLLALVIASPLAWYAASQWLDNFAYRIDVDWWVFGLAGLLAVLIAFLTISYQAIKAALANPVKSLRNE